MGGCTLQRVYYVADVSLLVEGEPAAVEPSLLGEAAPDLVAIAGPEGFEEHREHLLDLGPLIRREVGKRDAGRQAVNAAERDRVLGRQRVDQRLETPDPLGVELHLVHAGQLVDLAGQPVPGALALDRWSVPTST